ncbi:hypothetical protein TNIN_381301 [Trichonephila inaurata madagascariensis]|uniref:Uncharacterized protein n=1 Tax=Trichonephila inaurata madagascariensis TaxID=2747483 RepID=A0A8X7C5A9_9ARAC|nr:hypothetical protein TNIN_381301 [Trichonephila inaurata madagascariensis]
MNSIDRKDHMAELPWTSPFGGLRRRIGPIVSEALHVDERSSNFLRSAILWTFLIGLLGEKMERFQLYKV